jgi:anti-anti-sigma factor
MPCAASPPFGYRIESGEDRVVVFLRGELVFEALSAIRDCWGSVRESGKAVVALDLSEATFLASAALGSILSLRRWLDGRGRRLEIVAMSPEVREIISIAGLDWLLCAREGAGDPAS